jgi:hypothetical protein
MDLEVLIMLYELHKKLTDLKEKEIINELIKKREVPFLIDVNLKLTDKELGYGKNYINKIFNQKIEFLIPNFEFLNFKEQDSYLINFYRKNHWLNFNNDYNELVLVRSQFFKKEKTKIKKETLNVLNLYTEQKIVEIIKNNYKL